MTLMRTLIAAFLFAAAGMWAASPASAVPAAGFYAYEEEGLPPSTWSFSPTCLPPDFCYLHVTSSTHAQNTFTERTLNFGGVAQLVNGEWTLVVNKPEGIQCADGTVARSVDTYKFDQGQTGGTHTISHTRVCGLEPALITKPFGLRFEGPPAYPIEPFPLDCADIRFWCPY